MTRPANHHRLHFGSLPKRLPNIERNARIVALYTAGLSSVDVGRRVGVTPTAVLYVLRREGVELRSLAESQRLGRQRAARLRLIAEAAQRTFGHLRVPGAARAAVRPPPVNALWDDEVLDVEVGWFS